MIIKYYMTWKEVTRILLVYYESRASQYEIWKKEIGKKKVEIREIE